MGSGVVVVVNRRRKPFGPPPTEISLINLNKLHMVKASLAGTHYLSRKVVISILHDRHRCDPIFVFRVDVGF